MTGASGFIGRHVIALAERLGLQVLATSSRGHGRFVLLDVADPSSVSSVVSSFEPEIVVHLASIGVSEPAPFSELLRVNGAGVHHLLEGCAALSKPPTVVLAGSGFEYGPQDRPVREDDPVRPFSTYGVSKAAGSHAAYLFAGDLPLALLRLFNVFGPGEAPRRILPHIMRCTLERRPVETTAAEQVRDFVFAPDAAEALLRCALIAKRPYLTTLNLGSGNPTRLRDFINLAAAELSRRGHSSDVRFGAVPYRPGEPMNYCADCSRLAQALQWIPSTPLAEAIRLSIESMLTR